jgi:hypothetical protein
MPNCCSSRLRHASRGLDCAAHVRCQTHALLARCAAVTGSHRIVDYDFSLFKMAVRGVILPTSRVPDTGPRCETSAYGLGPADLFGLRRARHHSHLHRVPAWDALFGVASREEHHATAGRFGSVFMLGVNCYSTLLRGHTKLAIARKTETCACLLRRTVGVCGASGQGLS